MDFSKTKQKLSNLHRKWAKNGLIGLIFPRKQYKLYILPRVSDLVFSVEPIRMPVSDDYVRDYRAQMYYHPVVQPVADFTKITTP